MTRSAGAAGRRSAELRLAMARPAVGNARAAAVDPHVVQRSRDLLDRAEVLFDQAASVEDDGTERFRLFYLAAIRASGAILEVYEPTGKVRRRRGATDAWSRIKARAPECAELADYFGGLSNMRSRVEAGLVKSVDPTFCARVERRAVEFLDVADATLLSYEQGKLTPGKAAARSTVA
ncbi:SAV_6107 family HEPN domain-containing protein [Gordonia sp. (in: high G+C Gram-positive bacteria)]|uniref:SAV_6107 family HEPN domain-containing protein n=1 Tax=Gordonia sp. (in: high G+C Gram-positive bacteria) TaxID=84139 RepID=UPI0016B38A06|nr:SAV_6107 family HEPN domain-containing protein [Gordonia sp. (in: high G+C Gram-positive bacteria)]NLG44931.1 hypothetical protein [Gordonia sp. (in: high G+C Gram-positive bacteria)]